MSGRVLFLKAGIIKPAVPSAGVTCLEWAIGKWRRRPKTHGMKASDCGNAPTWLPELSKPLQSVPQGWPFPSWAGEVYCCSWIHIHEQQVFLLMPQLTLDLLSNKSTPILAPVPGCLSHRKSAQRRPASPTYYLHENSGAILGNPAKTVHWLVIIKFRGLWRLMAFGCVLSIA